MKIDLIIPAAGFASRFPVNKLLYSLHGKCILEHVLDVVEQLDFHAIYVVTQYPEIKQLLSKRKAVCVWNPQPQPKYLLPSITIITPYTPFLGKK